jgi:class 3 adenylate cyclase
MVGETVETRYTKTPEGAYLAYQVTGDGPLDVVVPITGSAAAELIWDEPHFKRFMARLSSIARVVTFDPRGFGSSGRLAAGSVPALQIWKDDIVSVMDAAQCRRAAILAWGEAAGAAMFFAATYPERANGLVLINAYARFWRSAETPWGLPLKAVPAYVDAIRDAWGSGRCLEALAPSIVSSPEARRHWARIERLTATPDVLGAATQAVLESDVSDVLPAIQPSVLVISRSDDRHVPSEHGRYVASRIPDAKLVELPGQDHVPFAGDVDALLDEVQEFLTGVRPSPTFERVLATVLFTDIVGSTERLSALGDHRWRHVLNDHHAIVRKNLEYFRGVEIDTAGDGFLATFDGPARAIQCACAIRDEVKTLGIEIRAGLHTGEVEYGDGDLAGLAVHIGARVAAGASASEVLVSRTVKDLVTGSGITFAERGERVLKGVSGSWQLYAAQG